MYWDDKIAAALIVVGSWGSAAGCAQLVHPAEGTSRSFEVASVKQSLAEVPGPNYQLSNARFYVEHASLSELIRFAYDIKSDDQLPKEPGWITSEKFDVDAKVDDADVAAMGKMLPDEKLRQYRLMVQSLLEDRFKLKVSVHMKELPVYALVVAKGGPKLTPVNVPPEVAARRMPTMGGWSRGDLKAGDVSMTLFSDWLSGRMDTGNRVVIDATGLQGSYDFTLNWTPDNMRIAQQGAGASPGSTTGALPDSSGLSIFTALQEQLGLKLESRRAPVEVLAIDYLEHLSPN